MYKQITSNKRKTALLITLFIAFIVGIGYVFVQTSTTYGGNGLILMALFFSVGMSLTGYYSGDKIALISAGALKIEKQDNPYVYRIVENLSITAGIPIPKIHIIESPSMNAFATGRDPEHASIALTTGLVNGLENEELEGVIAHELSHIKNYDIRLATVIIVLVGFIAFLSDWGMRAQFFGNKNRDQENNQLGIIIFAIGILFAIISPIIATIIQLAISRKREFLADADGALLTRYPDGLANALQKIENQNIPLKKASTATAHLYIANPFKGTKGKINKLFSTHPPTAERIKELRSMTGIE